MPTRRDFLASAAGAVLAACSGCRPEDSARRTVIPPQRDGVAPADHLDALDAAIEAAGGVRVGRGDRVVLKVNTNSGDPYPYSTSPAVVRHLAERFRDAGAEVVVADRSFWGDGDTAGNFVDNGIAAAAAAGGAELLALDEDDEAIDWVEIPAELVPDWRPPVRVPRLAVEADHLINLACMKTHFITGCTLALKNFLGLVHAGDRARPGNLRSHGDRIHHQVAQIHRFVKARLHVVDGWRALVAGGPTPSSGAGPRFADARVVLASVDPVQVDAAAIEILRTHAPPSEEITRAAARESPPIRAAIETGL